MGASFGHGFRLLPGVEAEEFFARFRGQGDQLACKLTAARLAQLAQATADDRFLGRDPKTSPSPIELAIAHMRSRYEQCQVTKRREPEDDVQCEASYVEREGRTYVLLHAEMTDYHDLLAATDGIERWPWYDADSPPSGVSCAEWDRRRDVWYEIMKDHGWSMPGVFRLLDDLPEVSSHDIIAALPSLDRRARRVALPNLVARRCETPPKDMSAAIEAVIEASSWINETEEGQKALKSEIASVATQLARSTFGLDGAPGESAMEARDVQHGR
jgi:hypothetical protein